MDYLDDLDLGGTAEIKPLYPAHLCHPVIIWDQVEEQLQFAALSWFLDWRKYNPFALRKGDLSHFTKPVPHKDLWFTQKARMTDWAWAEAGGLDLEQMWDILHQRHTIQTNQRPPEQAGVE